MMTSFVNEQKGEGFDKRVSLCLLLVFLFAIISCPSNAQQKRMCITVDDLPTVTNGISGLRVKLDITNGITRVCERYDIPAIGYVNEGKLYSDAKLDSLEVKLLEIWLGYGLELGNHTFSHFNYHRVPFETYTDDILNGERVIKNLAENYRTEIRFFRHPYLRAGLRKSHADSLKTFLTEHGYTEAPVTIDNEDYLFAAAYSKAYQKKDTKLMAQIGKDYIHYMEEKLLFYERQSMKMFNRHIKQTLLIHASLLNANYLEELVKMCIRHGYSFESQSEILKDPAYTEEVTRFGDWGISWLDRWALSRGEKGEFFKGDTETPDYIRTLAGGE